MITHFETVRKLKKHPDFAENDFLEEYDYKVELGRLLGEKNRNYKALILCKDALEEDHRNEKAKKEIPKLALTYVIESQKARNQRF